jgi:hypothetical protein
VDLDEIVYGGDDTEDDLDSTLFNSAASIIQKWRKFKLLSWVQLFYRLLDLDEIVYGGDDIDDNLDSILLNSVASTIPKWTSEPIGGFG